jgi:hypothetical protein
MSNNNWWGVSIHCDAKACDSSIVLNADKLKKWVEQLVKEIKMDSYGECQVVHFGEAGTDKEGFTAIQLLTTSAIVVHACDQSRDAYIDIFTCRCLPNLQYLVEQYIMNTLNPVHLTIEKLYRKA